MTFDDRLEKIFTLARELPRKKTELMQLAARSLQFTVRDTAYEVDLTAERLNLFDHTRIYLGSRQPLGGPESRVAVMLSYNGSAWLNTVITSTYIVGNRVLAKFASRGSALLNLTQAMYEPIFGDAIHFYQGSGRQFMEEVLRDPGIPAVVVFGFDANILPYEEAFRQSGKKLIFEGPGVDPFIVLPDADLDQALGDLMQAKFAYSGQTCTAPKRIFIHRQIYDEFLARLVAQVRLLKVGDPLDPATQISPVASGLAVARIKVQLKDAVDQGARVLVGGEIEGNLIRPTVVRDATDAMLGMQEEVFGPVAFTSPFDTAAEVVARARQHRYGLRAAVWGGAESWAVARALKGEDYCHPVPGYVFGKFGNVAVNRPRSETWRGSLVTKAIGGYGHSGWIWETVDGKLQIKQGPKLLSLETSRPG